MAKNNQKQPTLEDKERLLGFHPEWIESAAVGGDKKYGYKKLKNKLKLASNNYKRSISVYVSSAQKDDVKELLHFLKPPKERAPVSG